MKALPSISHNHLLNQLIARNSVHPPKSGDASGLLVHDPQRVSIDRARKDMVIGDEATQHPKQIYASDRSKNF